MTTQFANKANNVKINACTNQSVNKCKCICAQTGSGVVFKKLSYSPIFVSFYIQAGCLFTE